MSPPVPQKVVEGSAKEQPATPADAPAATEAPQTEDELAARRNERRLEREALVEQREELKNLQLRREVEQMEAEAERSRKTAEAARKAATGGSGEEAVRSVRAARVRPRHVVVLLSFVIMVALPTGVAAWYLWTRAYDRYASTVGFSIRTEKISSALELLGGVAQLSGSSTSDSEIVYQFIKSPELVATAQKELDLRKIWAKADPAVDPVFAYHPPGTIEDLTAYWSRMVKVYSSEGSGLIDLEVQAFTPEDAQKIAQLIYRESSNMINKLSAVAREDSTKYAREELDQAVERLKTARAAITKFRNVNQIVDPQASIQSQMGILSSLQSQLAQTMVELDLLKQSISNESDPRVVQAQHRIEVIQTRIAEERRKLGIGSGDASVDEGGNAFADLMGDYERLTVDLQFAEHAYTGALAAYDSAVAEARRQTRYLAPHVSPTLAQASTYPKRGELTALVALFSFLAWGLAVLVGYSLRDRR